MLLILSPTSRRFSVDRFLLRSRRLSPHCSIIRHYATSNESSSLSYLEGPSSPPLLELTIGEMFDATCQKFPNNTAIVAPFQGIRWNYQELQHQVNKLAGKLLSMGLVAGDRVGIWSPNNVEWIVAQMATAKIGIILVNINPAYRVLEVQYAIDKVSCKALITAEDFHSSKYVEMLFKLAPELKDLSSPMQALEAKKLPHLKHVIHLGSGSYNGIISYHRDLMAAGDDPAELKAVEETAKNVRPTDPINLQFTSGTTSPNPKVATLNSLGLVNNGNIVGERMKLTSEDILCLPVPLYHCFGMVLGNLACFSRGASVVMPNPVFCAAKTLQAVYDEKCSALHGVPTMFQAMLHNDLFDKARCSATLRTGIMAGTSCPVPLMKQVMNEMGMGDITICYGMTETSPVSFQSTTETPFDYRVSTVGTVHPHVQAKVIDPVSGETLPRGQVGELLTRGYLVMSGYWSDPERTEECLGKDGWMHTGDLARFTEEGYCQIEGRMKEIINRGGENIYPREIEDFLLGMEGLVNVQVFGIPDEMYGEVVCAWIKVKDDAQQKVDEAAVREYCREAISYFKVPKYIRFVQEFPMTVTGKPQKYVMQED